MTFSLFTLTFLSVNLKTFFHCFKQFSLLLFSFLTFCLRKGISLKNHIYRNLQVKKKHKKPRKVRKLNDCMAVRRRLAPELVSEVWDESVNCSSSLRTTSKLFLSILTATCLALQRVSVTRFTAWPVTATKAVHRTVDAEKGRQTFTRVPKNVTESTDSEAAYTPAKFSEWFFEKISWLKPTDMPTSSATSLIVIRRSFITISFTFSSVVNVLGRPGRSSSSTFSRPSWKRLYHS